MELRNSGFKRHELGNRCETIHSAISNGVPIEYPDEVRSMDYNYKYNY